MKLSKLLSDNLVVADLSVKTKEEAVAALLDRICSEYPLLDRDKLADAIAEREREENTSYGHGFAFPHARTDEVNRMYIAVGLSKNGLVGQTPDNEPLRVVCLMLTPSNISQFYLQTLSAFARLARNGEYLQKLLHARNSAEVIDVIHSSGVKVDRDLLVRDIMVDKVVSVKLDTTLKEVANLLYKHRIGSMPVVGEQGKLRGQISNRDLITAALPDYKSLIESLSMAPDVLPFDDLLKATEKRSVEEVMEKDETSCNEDTPVVELAAMMIFKNLRMVPVVRDERVVGVVVMSDIVSKIIRG
jgi:PTS system fructose-specific IIC component